MSVKSNGYTPVPKKANYIILNQTKNRESRFIDLGVYLTFLEYYNLDKKCAWIGVEALATKLNLGTKTVKNSIKRLVELGIIQREKNGTKLSNLPRTSMLTVPKIYYDRNLGDIVDHYSGLKGTPDIVVPSVIEDAEDEVPF